VQPEDAKAFRMILPEVRDASVALVALSTSDERVIAAAALTKSMRPKPPEGPGVAVHVIPPWRRQGIGSALVAALSAAAAQAGAEAIFAIQKVEAGSPAEQGWRWLGLEPLETVVYHELPLAAVESRLAPLYDWMREKQGIPAGAEIIALCDADREAVADLHVNVLGGHRGRLISMMRGEGLGAYHPRYSRVLLVDGVVKGCLLAHRESKDVAVVDANILDPTVRGGWANLWLKLEATRGAV
jgi:GNAT superfamily N-acetyltransferase